MYAYQECSAATEEPRQDTGRQDVLMIDGDWQLIVLNSYSTTGPVQLHSLPHVLEYRCHLCREDRDSALVGTLDQGDGTARLACPDCSFGRLRRHVNAIAAVEHAAPSELPDSNAPAIRCATSEVGAGADAERTWRASVLVSAVRT